MAKASNLRRLVKLVKLHHAKFVVLCEPKLYLSKINSIRLRLSFDFVCVNLSGDIWVFYSSSFVCSVVGNSDQHISLSVHYSLLPGSLIMSFVHARCSVEERRDLWRNLLTDKPSSSPWCIGGDFNVIMAPHEKRGAVPLQSGKVWNCCPSWRRMGWWI